MSITARKLKRIYARLYESFGPQHWWPADTAFEVVVGAILTQNTSWENVEKALRNLKDENALSPEALAAMREKKLARLLRPVGYFNVKAKRLKAFLEFFRDGYGLSLKKLFALPKRRLRAALLGVNGIGRETADSIMLYAAGTATFVIDAYTMRVFSLHGFFEPGIDYDEARAFFETHLPRSVKRYNEFHALIVKLGKDYCRPRNPRCGDCPLKRFGRGR